VIWSPGAGVAGVMKPPASALAEGVGEGGHEGSEDLIIPGRVADRHDPAAGTDVWP